MAHEADDRLRVDDAPLSPMTKADKAEQIEGSLDALQAALLHKLLRRRPSGGLISEYERVA